MHYLDYLKECYWWNAATYFNRQLHIPEFREMKEKAKAVAHFQPPNIYSFNPILAEAHKVSLGFLNVVLYHEMCHHACHQLHEESAAAHSYRWYSYMEKIGVNPKYIITLPNNWLPLLMKHKVASRFFPAAYEVTRYRNLQENNFKIVARRLTFYAASDALTGILREFAGKSPERIEKCNKILNDDWTLLGNKIKSVLSMIKNSKDTNKEVFIKDLKLLYAVAEGDYNDWKVFPSVVDKLNKQFRMDYLF